MTFKFQNDKIKQKQNFFSKNNLVEQCIEFKRKKKLPNKRKRNMYIYIDMKHQCFPANTIQNSENHIKLLI